MLILNAYFKNERSHISMTIDVRSTVKIRGRIYISYTKKTITPIAVLDVQICQPCYLSASDMHFYENRLFVIIQFLLQNCKILRAVRGCQIVRLISIFNDLSSFLRISGFLFWLFSWKRSENRLQ